MFHVKHLKFFPTSIMTQSLRGGKKVGSFADTEFIEDTV
jgi:hypothetical protein